MRKQIEFLDRLFKLIQCRGDILDFLKSEKLITDDQKQQLLHDNHETHSTKIASLLNELQQSEQLHLVSYEWTVLPSELMKLTIVSSNDKKEFIYTV